MDPDNYEYLPNNDNYNEEEDESPIYNSNENSGEDNYDSNQNNDEMFGVFDDINQKFEKCTKDIEANKMIGKMNDKIAKENFERLNKYKNYIYFKNNNNIEDDFDSDNKFNYTNPLMKPLMMSKQFGDLSNTNNNYPNYNTSSNYNQINSKGTFYSNNDLGYNDDFQINNNLYQNNDNINPNYLNYNQKEIKKGFIKKSNSNLSNIKNKKNNEYNFQNMDTPENLNQMNFSNDIENVMNEINSMRNTSIMISYNIAPKHLNVKAFVNMLRYLKETRVKCKHDG
jgi:hypothetical protein